jgi:hypothetical protein
MEFEAKSILARHFDLKDDHAGGGSVLETFLQKEPSYSGRDLFYLRPRTTLSDEELLFYALCIQANAFKYSFGRQANRTLRDLPIPAPNLIPADV